VTRRESGLASGIPKGLAKRKPTIIRTRNRKHRRATAKLATYTKLLTLSTVRREGWRKGGKDGGREEGKEGRRKGRNREVVRE